MTSGVGSLLPTGVSGVAARPPKLRTASWYGYPGYPPKFLPLFVVVTAEAATADSYSRCRRSDYAGEFLKHWTGGETLS